MFNMIFAPFEISCRRWWRYAHKDYKGRAKCGKRQKSAIFSGFNASDVPKHLPRFGDFRRELGSFAAIIYLTYSPDRP
jgi:hypothetical protein